MISDNDRANIKAKFLNVLLKKFFFSIFQISKSGKSGPVVEKKMTLVITACNNFLITDYMISEREIMIGVGESTVV